MWLTREGYHAGYAGAALAIMDWGWQLENPGKPMPGKTPYENEQLLVKEVQADLNKGLAKTQGKCPQILVIGALGRCGRGALDLARAVGVPESNLLKWDLDETKKGGPFVEIRESDVSGIIEVIVSANREKIFINCIYLSADIPKFVTKEFLKEGERGLSVVCDVSCESSKHLSQIAHQLIRP